jgi:hypothetical protein
LLKVMVMLDDVPHSFEQALKPEGIRIVAKGRLLRTQLPLHLEEQRATIAAHSVLPVVLVGIVAAYAAPTHLVWADRCHTLPSVNIGAGPQMCRGWLFRKLRTLFNLGKKWNHS